MKRVALTFRVLHSLHTDFHAPPSDTRCSLDGPCPSPGVRKLNLDPYGDILPNATLDEDSAWEVGARCPI